MRALASVVVLLWAGTAVAQIDEQPPVIRRSPSSPIDQGQPQSETRSDKKPSDTVTGSGIVRGIDAKKIQVAIDDGRTFNAAIDGKTAFIGPGGKIDPELIKPGTRVRISAKMNLEQDLTATSVVIEKNAALAADKPEEDAATQKTEDTDPDRPVLKRGIPKRGAATAEPSDKDSEDAPVVAESKENAEDSSLVSALAADNQPELLKKAREVNNDFITHLPNFVCQQFTTRYERENKVAGWHAKDIVSATVVYEGRKERYENIKINNHAANAEMMAIKGGSTSTGEFGSFLEGLFAADVNASFRYLHAESFRQVHTKVFSYAVKRENTDWTVSNGGQSIEPAYSGRVWINSETGRVMRIEREADNIPEAFPFKVVEQTVDYDMVMLGGRKVLLPVESSNLACDRSSPDCSKNEIQFRDYKEFRGAATVTFDK